MVDNILWQWTINTELLLKLIFPNIQRKKEIVNIVYNSQYYQVTPVSPLLGIAIFFL